eukprot:4794296-Prymnesium_polylepis.1
MGVGGSAMRGIETDGSGSPCASHACPPSTIAVPETPLVAASVHAPVSHSPATAPRTYVKRAIHPRPRRSPEKGSRDALGRAGVPHLIVDRLRACASNTGASEPKL